MIGVAVKTARIKTASGTPRIVGAARPIKEPQSLAASIIPKLNILPDDEFLDLSAREKKILGLLVEGKSRREIASKLGLTAHSVSVVIARARQREHFASMIQLLVRYLKEYYGLLDPVWDRL